jgi:D-alanyl-D-alanine carboxypeptidase (penicillin-binding protein 5/6)
MATGTSAELVEGDSLSVWDLLHGLMLPSGNDAALALAEYFGK